VKKGEGLFSRTFEPHPELQEKKKKKDPRECVAKPSKGGKKKKRSVFGFVQILVRALFERGGKGKAKV